MAAFVAWSKLPTVVVPLFSMSQHPVEFDFAFVVYLDDLLFITSDRQVKELLDLLWDVFHLFGFSLSPSKSDCSHQSQVEFLGYLLSVD